jgi:hypothetical protein
VFGKAIVATLYSLGWIIFGLIVIGIGLSLGAAGSSQPNFAVIVLTGLIGIIMRDLEDWLQYSR